MKTISNISTLFYISRSEHAAYLGPLYSLTDEPRDHEFLNAF